MYLANPGLIHILEKIYLTLDSGDLDNCALLSKSLAVPLKDPRFWHKMCLLKRQDPVKTLKGLFQLTNQNKEAREDCPFGVFGFSLLGKTFELFQTSFSNLFSISLIHNYSSFLKRVKCQGYCEQHKIVLN